MAKTYQVLTDESIEKIKRIIKDIEWMCGDTYPMTSEKAIADLKAIIADVES